MSLRVPSVPFRPDLLADSLFCCCFSGETSWKLEDRTGACLIPGFGAPLLKVETREYTRSSTLYTKDACADTSLGPFRFTINDSFG